MAYANSLDFHRPSSQLSMDRKPTSFLDDLDSNDDAILDSSIMLSPVSADRRDSFGNSTAPMFSPQSTYWEDFPSAPVDRTASVSTNPWFDQMNSNNPFARSETTATYGQQSTAWPLFDRASESQTPTNAHYDSMGSEFESSESYGHVANAPSFGGLPVQAGVRPSSVFPPAQAATPMSASPSAGKDWMPLPSNGMDSRPIPKRMRPNTPPRPYSPFPRRDGIRKKNARFAIPAERSLHNIDQLIANSTNEEEIKELKQQKRLLRNRQAALDSRQRKKKHTEELEEEKKSWNDRMSSLQDQLESLQLQVDQHHHEKEQWAREQIQTAQHIETLTWEKEDLVRNHTLETGELRKKISVLTEKLEVAANGMPPSAGHSAFNDFTTDMDNLHMGNDDWNNYIFVNDLGMDFESANQPPQNETTLVLSQKKKEPAGVDVEKQPVASGLLLMLLLCGAFVASRSSNSQATIPRMPDEVRQASATVLDNILKDASVDTAPSNTQNLIVNHVNGLDPAPSGTVWPKSISGLEFASLSQPSNLDQLHNNLVAPTKDQEAEQIFSMTPQQYNSLTSADYTRRVYSIPSTTSEAEDEASPGSQPSQPRRNLAETLAAMREQSKGQGAAEVYTRSLLWDRIPTEVVREFKRMVEGSSSGGEGEV